MFLGSALVLGLIGSALFGDEGVSKHDKLRSELRNVQALNAELREENRRLRLEAEALRDNPAYIEHVIRDELGWVRSDELVFIFDQ